MNSGIRDNQLIQASKKEKSASNKESSSFSADSDSESSPVSCTKITRFSAAGKNRCPVCQESAPGRSCRLPPVDPSGPDFLQNVSDASQVSSSPPAAARQPGFTTCLRISLAFQIAAQILLHQIHKLQRPCRLDQRYACLQKTACVLTAQLYRVIEFPQSIAMRILTAGCEMIAAERFSDNKTGDTLSWCLKYRKAPRATTSTLSRHRFRHFRCFRLRSHAYFNSSPSDVEFSFLTIFSFLQAEQP